MVAGMTPNANEILTDPCASFWLKSALRAALDRDAVDAANDAAMLADVLAARADQQLR